MLYGSDTHRVFHTWWMYAEAEYLRHRNGELTDTLTMYYDPLVNHHHRVGLAGGLALMFQLVPQNRDAAQQLFEAAIEHVGWTTLDPLREITRDRNTLVDTPQGSILGLILAREFGHDAVYAKLKAHAESHYEPHWDTETGEFTWGFGLNEPYPRGQFNAAMMVAEASSTGTWWRVFNEPNLRKFTDPSVHGVDFPTVCVSQAWYDVERRRLVVATDAGVPGAQGQPTSFRVSQLDLQRCSVIVDGQPSEDWRIVDSDIEITTTVGQHTFLITN